MKPVVKVLLGGCAVLLVLGVVAVVFLVRYVGANKDRWMGEAKQVRAEAETFGRTTTQSGCVTAALDRYRKDQTLVGQIRTRVWLGGCLEGASVDPAFCRDVPQRTEISRTVTWRLAECSRRGFDNDSNCANLLTAVQEHCERKR